MSCTSLSKKARAWCEAWRDAHKGRMRRAFDVKVPNALVDYSGFIREAEKRALDEY